MAIETAQPQASYDGWRDRRWRLTGLAFAILWLVTAIGVVLAGEKRSDLNTLVGSVANGSVTRVQVVGLPRDPDWRGQSQVTLRWQGSWIERFAEVTVDSRRASGPRDGDRIRGDVATYLHGYDPDLAITYSDHTGYQEWREWRGPGWAAGLGLAAWLGTVLLAGAAPQPWRATQWAWIWLIMFGGPLGSVAFLLVGGPLGLWRPKDLTRRLTGGWAFLLALVFLGGANAD